MLRRLGILAVAGVALMGCGSSLSSLHSNDVQRGRELAVRGVLCFAPPYRADTSTHAIATPIATSPVCGSLFALTRHNIDVTVNPTTSSGYSARVIGDDPIFARVATTPLARVATSRVVILPGLNAPNQRYVLGPVVLRAKAVASAQALKDSFGEWVVDVKLTSAGSRLWDRVTSSYFHEYLAVIVNGKVVAAPLVSPTSEMATSFNGSIEVSGHFTHAEALAIVASV